MSRYIDKDKLLKSTISKFKCVPLVGVFSYRNGEEHFDGEYFVSLINETPTADVVEVVRCKDCRNSRVSYDEEIYFCMHFADTVDGEAFCSYAERKEE